MKATLFIRSLALVCFAIVTSFRGSSTLAADFDLINPHWNIIIDDAGYSDLAFDQRPGFEGREYLSGEWAGAVSFVRGGVLQPPTWLTPEFLFPDWTANSDFSVESPVAQIGVNSHGMPVVRSVIANGSLRIAITSQMIDTTNGIPQGLSPRSSPTGSNTISDRYVFKQSFSITNISGETLTGLCFFQFLHALEASRVVYDDRIYGATLNGHRYTISQQSPSIDPVSGDVIHLDTVALHANLMPSSWEAGRYGIYPTDNHATGKPSVGVHLSVEADALSGADYFESSFPWVGGAVRCDLGTLSAGASTNIEFLMTIQTVTLAAAPFRVPALNQLKAWGENSGGQTNVPAATNVSSVVAGGQHALALLENETVVAWGDNSFNQTNVPPGLVRVRSIAAGENHSLALQLNFLSDNTVYAWGDNSSGQTNVPVFPDDVWSVAAGGNHSLALLYDDTVVGWGDNSAGQATPPPGLDDVEMLAAGSKHSLALLYDGTVVAWGDNTLGQTHVPGGLSFVQAIAAGGNHSLALKYDGTVVAWGDNSSGQASVPNGLSDVSRIAAGRNHSIALTYDGTIVSWGSNSAGQTNEPSGGGVFKEIAAGGNFNLGRRLVPAAIALNISRAGTNVNIGWGAELYADEAVGAILETAGSMNGTNWSAVAGYGLEENGSYRISLPIKTNQFFRLKLVPSE